MVLTSERRRMKSNGLRDTLNANAQNPFYVYNRTGFRVKQDIQENAEGLDSDGSVKQHSTLINDIRCYS